MDSTDLVRLDATAQADLVRQGEVTPVELVEAAIEAVERLDPQLGAVFIPTPEHALDHARTVSTGCTVPGVPILVKDMALELAGYPYGHGGLRLLRDRGYVSDRTTYLAAGLGRPGSRSWAVARRHCRGWSWASPIWTCTRCPATPGTPTTPPAGRAAGPPRPSPPVWCRWPTATTAVAPCGCRPRSAGWSRSNRPGDGCLPAR